MIENANSDGHNIRVARENCSVNWSMYQYYNI